MSNEKDMRNDILNAATKVFIAKGKSGARMQEIADEAGVNKMLLHYYFKSKELLFEEVLKNTLTDLYYSVIEISYNTDNFKDALEIFIEKHFEYLYKNRDVLSFLLWEVSHTGQNMQELITQTFQRLGNTPLDALTKKINEAMSSGEIKKIQPSDFILNLFSLNVFFFIAFPFIELFSNMNNSEVQILMEQRKKEIFRILWNDIKR
ncbi:TetR/AcrR family transcriptional regulator [Anaerocolumna jejuensis]|uniref:TetR/AcrR family transcriptional regulator n=1 Tax=Anaerocolumna jejuensis TaxID=259063 RepID=UPI003F7C3B7B